ncbi:MAG TPA: NAD(P)-binding domain-containing protein, partial [Thermoplasmata archaeon]|nr:NAD(P)-binding domain-containing protein [Thermoplasmata archaeon]
VGKRLAEGFAVRGHEVVIGTRTPGKPDLVQWAATLPGKVSIASLTDAARAGQLLVLAVHGDAALAAVESAGPAHFAGKVLIDVTNPLVFSTGEPPSLFVGTTDSLGERVQRAVPAAKVVKAFNTVGSPQMVDPHVQGQTRLELLIAGNDAGAKRQVTEVVTSFGWNGTVDVGGIDGARWLEAMVPLWVRVAGPIHTFSHIWVVARDGPPATVPSGGRNG